MSVDAKNADPYVGCCRFCYAFKGQYGGECVDSDCQCHTNIRAMRGQPYDGRGRTPERSYQVEIRDLVNGGWTLDRDHDNVAHWYTLDEANGRVLQLAHRDIEARVF